MITARHRPEIRQVPELIQDSGWCKLTDQGNQHWVGGDLDQAGAFYLKALLRVQDSLGRYWISQTDYHWPAMLIVSTANYARVLLHNGEQADAARVLGETAGLMGRTIQSPTASAAAKEGCVLHAPRLLGQVIVLSVDWVELRHRLNAPLEALKQVCRRYLEDQYHGAKR